jgi:hypothetical protein
LSLQINANETPRNAIVAGVIMASDCDFGDGSAGEVTLLVASQSADVLLLSGQRPLWPDLGIEVNVDFVEVFRAEVFRRRIGAVV